MTTVNASAWRPPLELAVLPQPAPGDAMRAPAPVTATNRPAEDDGFKLFGDDGFTFLDFLDIINPLHHIPIIGTLYRHFSGDEIDPGSRVLGGTLFFGPLGTVASIGDVLIRDATGKDLGQHAMAMFDQQTPRPSEVAEAGGLVVADAGTRSANAVVASAHESPHESEALDPVTHWAMEEAAFQQAMAAKVQSSMEVRPEVRQRAAAPMPAVAAAYDHSRQALVAAGLAEPAPTPASRPAGRLMAESTGAPKAQSIIRHTKRSAAMMAAAGYGRIGQPAERRNGEEPGDEAAATPPGAVAPLGGWFADTMLKANDKYQAAAVRSQDRFPTTLDVRQ